jgi:CARDB protein
MPMRRALIICACTSAVAATAAPPAAAALPDAVPGRAPDARATLIACRFALAQPARFAVFGGSMASMRHGNDRLQMRFEVYRRLPGALRFQRIQAPGLGSWNKASAGVTRYRFRQKVENLPAPAFYRAVVSFRWLNAAGKVFARAKRTTPTCFQPDPRPDLRVAKVTGMGVGGGDVRYDVFLRNGGRSAASDFDVVLNVNGLPQPASTVAELGAGGRRVVAFTGPRCAAGSQLKVDVDSDNRVVEADEANNSLTVDCPPPTGG